MAWGTCLQSMSSSSSHIKQNKQVVAESAPAAEAGAGLAMISGHHILEWYRVLPNETRGYARWVMITLFPTGVKSDGLYLMEHFDQLKRKIDTYQTLLH
jgi:hypothetical protein